MLISLIVHCAAILCILYSMTLRTGLRPTTNGNTDPRPKSVDGVPLIPQGWVRSPEITSPLLSYYTTCVNVHGTRASDKWNRIGRERKR